MMPSRKETLIELLMTAVFPLLGGTITIVFLQSSTTWPLWLCMLLGLPFGAVLAWTLVLGSVCAICNIVLEPLARIWARR